MRPWTSKPRKAKPVRAPSSTPAPGAGQGGVSFLPPGSEPLSTITRKSNGKYVSDCDPGQEWDTFQDALAFEKSLPLSDPVSAGRARTLFTYTSKKSHNKLGTRAIPNGPHGVGNAALEFSLFGARGRISLLGLFSEQVRPPKQWRKAVEAQMGSAIFSGKTEMSLRILRAYRDYLALYRTLVRVLKGRDTLLDPMDLIHELVELDPYTVYKYWAPETASKKDLKGKGENNDLTNPKNIDTRAKFKNSNEYLESVNNRMLLLDEDHASDDEESESDEEYEKVVIQPNEEREIALDGEIYIFSPDEVPSNGDCFFESLRSLGVSRSVDKLRRLARTNGGHANITDARVWADEQDIAAVALALGIRIRVVALDNHYSIREIKNFGVGGAAYNIAHIFGGHFTPLRN